MDQATFDKVAEYLGFDPTDPAQMDFSPEATARRRAASEAAAAESESFRAAGGKVLWVPLEAEAYARLRAHADQAGEGNASAFARRLIDEALSRREGVGTSDIDGDIDGDLDADIDAAIATLEALRARVA